MFKLLFANILCLSCFFVLSIRAHHEDTIFIAIAPKIITPNSDQKIYISGEDGAGPLPCSVVISHRNYSEPVAKENAVIEPGKTIEVKLSLKDLQFDRYNLTITTQPTETTKKVYTDRAVLYVDRQTRSNFIQTDKPIYKPGETVRYRVVVLNRALRPISTPPQVDISIFDPSRNLIKSYKKVAVSESGILSKSLELSAEPNLGDWVIKIDSDNQRTEHIFKVDKYVLPKFKAVVKLPNYITVDNSKMIAEVSAEYTYGKKVKGEATVTLSQNLPYWYSRDQRNAKITKTVPIDGEVAFVEFNVKRDLNITETYDKEFQVSATFTESITGLQQNATSKIKMYQYAYKIKSINQPDSYKPGFPLKMFLQISTQDDVPISDPRPDALQISHGFAWEDSEGHLNTSIPSNGIVELSFNTPTNELIHINNMDVKYKDLTEKIWLPRKLTTTSKFYMQLYLLTKTPKTNEDIKLKVKTNRPVKTITYAVLCRGKITAFEKLSVPEQGTKEQDFEVKIPASCSPKGKIIVYTTDSLSHEIIADSAQFSMSTVLDNFLNIKLSNQTLEPGSNLSISLETQPKSTIALRGVDQSVLILKENSDIDMKAAEGSINSLGDYSNQHRLWGGSNSHEIFDESGVVILTNAVIDKPNPDPYEPYAYHAFSAQEEISMDEVMLSTPRPVANTASKISMNAASFSVGGAPAPGGRPSAEVRVRTEFPETWIFEEVNGTDQGMISNLVKTVPDTITSWVITGFSINHENGLGVSLEPQKLTTFRPFFISLNLPYSVVKGEVFALQVLVHNYLDHEINVDVIVDNQNNTFEYLESKSDSDKTMPTKTITVPASQVSTVSFIVIPLSFGIKKLSVKGVSPMAGDGVSRPLIVKPPGQKLIRNSAVLLDLRSSGSSFEHNLTADFPESRVEGADSIKLTVIGDMLGATVSNLDKLLQLPTGCGEQNMLNFVVDIVVLDYLTSTSSLTPAIKAKAIRYLEKGYQRQLTYRRKDGSFSAFGNSDEFGSTWLTAFVIRSFIQAKPYITVDNKVIAQSLKYLAERQQPFGAFEELGRVLHSGLQGGSRSGGLAMSAYTLLTFIEASKHVEKFNYTSVISKGLDYISKKSDVIDDPYAINLITYTLQVADHPLKKTFVDVLESISKVDGDLKYWERKIVDPSTNTTNTTTTDEEIRPKRIWNHHPIIQPATVEMTAYALLTYLKDNRTTETLPIARWLTTQRNGQGGFKSTQDTVVGVTALAKFGLATRTKDSDLDIVAEYLDGQKNLKVNHDNEMEQQEVFLPDGAHWVNLKTTGMGSGLAQLTWSYYVETNDTEPSFDLDVKVKDTGSPKKLELNICGKYRKSGKSNMALMEVGLPTGYEFEKELLEKVKSSNVMRYETEDSDTKLILYFDSVDSKGRCVNLFASLTHAVAKQAPAHVLLYDYYDTTKQARASYDAPKISVCDICEYDKTCKMENCV